MKRLNELTTWIYRVQQRIAITRNEAAALLLVAVLLLLGLGVRYVQSRPRGLPKDTYAKVERQFQQATAALEAVEAKALEGAEVESEDVEAGPPPSAAAAADTVRMNLNQATASQLERLPRIGPVMAGRIVDYRRIHGSFRKIEHLERVHGIGAKTVKRLRPLLFVEAVSGKASSEEGR